MLFMRNKVSKLVVVLFVLFAISVIAVEPNTPSQKPQTAKAAVITCKGLIDDGLYQSIQRRTETAIDKGADYLIYEISTYGGLVKAADDISKYFINEAGKKAHTVAYITTEAISAGAMISVSCHDIIMRENSKIGDCAPVMLGGKLEGVEREKQESFIRAIFETAANANGYPRALLKAMVSIDIEVYGVKNIETGKVEYFESENLPKDKNLYDLDNKELIIPEDKILTLIASDALKHGIARKVVESRAQALDFLAERDGVVFTGETITFKPNWSEQMVRWLNSPAVMGVLVMLAMLGVYLELSSPGVGLPGLVAVICLIIIIGSKYTINLANWWEIALFTVGVLLLLVEVFVIPGFGVAGILGILCVFAGIFGMLVRNPPDELPWPHTTFDWQIFMQGVMGLSLGFIGFIILAWLFAKYLHKIQKFDALNGLVLLPATAKNGTEKEINITAPPEAKDTAVNIGDKGEVFSKMRPTGKVKFKEQIIDCVAEANFLDKGVEVKIISIHGNRVVVRAVKTKD